MEWGLMATVKEHMDSIREGIKLLEHMVNEERAAWVLDSDCDPFYFLRTTDLELWDLIADLDWDMQEIETSISYE